MRKRINKTKLCRIFEEDAQYVEKMKRRDEFFADAHKRLFRCKVRFL